jgi:hypothetical protein
LISSPWTVTTMSKPAASSFDWIAAASVPSLIESAFGISTVVDLPSEVRASESVVAPEASFFFITRTKSPPAIGLPSLVRTSSGTSGAPRRPRA